MEPTERKKLKSLKSPILSALIIGGILLYALPYIIKDIRNQRLELAKSKDISQPEVQEIHDRLRPILAGFNSGTMLAEKRGEDSYFAVFQNTTPIETATHLKSIIDSEDIECYLSVLDGFDAAIRIYAGPTLTHHIMFSPRTPLITEGAPNSNLREQPQLAIIIANLGNRDLNVVTRHPLPLSIGICPYQPFSLRIAEDAAQHFHEVLSDLRCTYNLKDSSILAIPYSSGSINTTPQTPNILLPRAVQIHPSDGSNPPSNNEMRISAQYAPHRSAMGSLARALKLSKELGIGALLINADDPELETVLEWSYSASSLGYRLVFASELGRFKSLIGPTETPLGSDI
jgi:hypothetical protein